MLTKGELCSCKVKKVILYKHSTLQLHETALHNKNHMHGVCNFNRTAAVYFLLKITLCAKVKSEIVTLLFAVSFNCWLCQAVSVKGEGLLSSRLFTAHHRALLLKAFTGWVTVTRLSQAHGTVKEMHQKRILDA